MIEKIVHSLISSRFLPDISYTGKGKQKERKVALCRYSHVLDFIKITTNKADEKFTDAQFKDKLIYGILKRAPSKYGGSSKNNEKEKESVKKAAQPNTSNDVVEKPTLQDAPVSQSPSIESDYQQPNYYYPPNSQPPNGQSTITYYPPQQPHQLGHSQQHHQQQQPYYYGQHVNFNGPNDIPWPTDVPSPAVGADYGRTPSTFHQM